jgi:DNA-binding response OmpR family regulator
MASSGQAALGLLNGSANSSQPVDLVITDLTMPAMSGVDFIREMRKRAFSMPVVVATGSIDSYPENEIQNIRADHILVKPFKPDHLTDCVKTILARHVGSQVATCPATGRRGKPADLPCRSAPAEAGARGATVARAEDDAAEVLPGGEVTGRTGTYG